MYAEIWSAPPAPRPEPRHSLPTNLEWLKLDLQRLCWEFQDQGQVGAATWILGILDVRTYPKNTQNRLANVEWFSRIEYSALFHVGNIMYLVIFQIMDAIPWHSLKLTVHPWQFAPEKWRLEDDPFLLGPPAYFQGLWLLVLGRVHSQNIPIEFCNLHRFLLPMHLAGH